MKVKHRMNRVKKKWRKQRKTREEIKKNNKTANSKMRTETKIRKREIKQRKTRRRVFNLESSTAGVSVLFVCFNNKLQPTVMRFLCLHFFVFNLFLSLLHALQGAGKEMCCRLYSNNT